MQNEQIYFKNRDVAAFRLLDVLPIESMKLEDWTVFATSYGGVPIAKIIANKLESNFDLILSSKIMAPNNEDCEIAIVTESEEVVIHEELAKAFEISLDFIFAKSKQIYDKELMKTVKLYRKDKRIENLTNKNVLLVDEGLNTGLTMMACIKTAINLGAKSVSVATPILPSASVPTIESIADDLYYVKKLDHFVFIDFYYDKLENINFEDIKNIK
ncbi:ABC transporter [Malaciobacter canalis]|jgi:putative phosphoribosyl transferase|uniref:Phosphoribosyl transferase n=2 Tax=Malaciobacter TaxID=2321114 RepID=A0AB36ZV63_9BACT|nr:MULTISPECIES: phosphoribosyltransferase family protein [Malaciobacter]PHO10878.1 ABC transporter [Malaciobacter canalis]PPK60771.1 putative phosphoribosyl transferase [Malaciobacter marinus]QEE32947.1 putative phosphoribosyltransferase [Malaciobacter canalis]